MKRLLSMTRMQRVVTLAVALVLLVALVGVGVWRQVGVRADAARTTFTVVSSPGDPWTDDTKASGQAAVPYPNAGCTTADGNQFCTTGGWVRPGVTIPTAHWIWETSAFQDTQEGHPATFSKTFTVPQNGSAIAGQLQITADNTFDVQVNGKEVGTGSNFGQLFTYDISADLQVGQNTITATVTNLPDPNNVANPWGNPAGLYYGATISYVADSTPPTTTATVAGTQGSNSWYTSAVTLTLAATDPDDASSALTTSYSMDNGASWQTYNGTLTFGQDGTYTVLYHSADPAGNVEANSTQSFKIDSTAPALNITGAASGTYNVCAGSAPSRPTFAPTDNLSGLDGTQGDSWTTPSTASGVGTYVYSAHAADLAGNKGQDTRTYQVVYGSAYSTPALPDSDDDGPSGVVTLGHHVFVWFQLMCNGSPITNAGATLTITPGTDVTAAKAETARGRKNRNTDVFQYNSNVQAYLLDVWTQQSFTNPDGSVVNFGDGTYTLTVSLDDGSTSSYTVQLGSGGRTAWVNMG